MASSIRSSVTSGSTVMTIDGIQLERDSTDTVLAIVAEVGQALSHLPYIKPLCALILQFIKIRNVSLPFAILSVALV
jgi:hypothetical protein